MNKSFTLSSIYKKTHDEFLFAFTFKKQIGKGCSGRVYKINEIGTKVCYALKEIGLSDQESVECAHNEMMFKSLNHNNLVKYDFLFIAKRPGVLQNLILDGEDSRPSSVLPENVKVKQILLNDTENKLENSSNNELSSQQSNKSLIITNKEMIVRQKMFDNHEKNARYNEIPEYDDLMGYLNCSDRKYCYFISEYCEFTFFDFIELRNDFYFINKQSNAAIEERIKQKLCKRFSISENKNNVHKVCPYRDTNESNKKCCLDIENIKNRQRKIINEKYFKTEEESSHDNNMSPKGKILNTNKKLVSYDSLGIKKRIPACFLEASFTQDASLNISFYLTILQEILKGLKYLHSLGIAHNDIKASNILFSKNLVPKIGDFGMMTRLRCKNDTFFYPINSSTGKYEDFMFFSNDLKHIGLLLFDMLWPIRTLNERFKLFGRIVQSRMLPIEFVNMYKNESRFIMECLDCEKNSISAEYLYVKLDDLKKVYA